MDMLRELVPFFAGALLLPPVLHLASRSMWSPRLRFWVTFVLSLLIGFAASALVGEQGRDLEESVMALIFDTALAYLGSQVAYWLFWQLIFERSKPQGDNRQRS